MNLLLVLANICAFLASLFLAFGTNFKTKKKILLSLIISDIFFVGANLLIWSLSAVTVNIIALIRDGLTYQKKLTKKLNLVLIAIVVVLSLVLNTKSLVGLLPIIATTQYALVARRARYPQTIRLAVLVATSIWAVHDLLLGLYASLPVYLVSIVIIAWNVRHFYRKRNLRHLAKKVTTGTLKKATRQK